MDNQQREQEALNPDSKEIAQLEAQLAEALAAEDFFTTASGKLSMSIAIKEIDKIVKEICSDKFLNDHRGYVTAICELKARKDWLRRLQVAASPARKAKLQEKLDEKENA